MIAVFSAAANGALLDVANVLTGFDPASSNINDCLRWLSTTAGTMGQIDVGGGGNSFVNIVELVGVSTDLTGLLNNGNLVLDS